MNTLTLSPAGLELIRSFESFSATVYICPAGKPTVGYGHVVKPAERFARPINREMAENLLLRDCWWVERVVNDLPLPLEQHEFDALVSFVFNVGSGNFADSTLRRKLVAGDKAGAADEFLRWDRAGGKRLAGLTSRRGAERAMFLRVA